MEFRKTLASTAVAFALVGLAVAPATAGTIDSWNTGNVVTDAGPYVDEITYSSVIYDQAGTSTSNAGSSSGTIVFTPPEGMAPGLEVDNDTVPTGNVDNCIIAAGSSSCNSEFQSGKRFKLNRTAFEPIDLVFNVDPAGEFDALDNDGLYKVFEKYGNATGSRIESFTVELGFGIGNAFIASTQSDGLGFVDFGTTPDENEFSSFFSAGLFGPGGDSKHPLEGYFSDQRAGFNLVMDSTGDFFSSAGIFGAYDDLFGDWLSYSQVPNGYFYDDDGDPDTDAILMANQEADGSWTIKRQIMPDGSVETLGTPQTAANEAGVVAVLDPNASLLSCDSPDYSAGPCLAGVDLIEDLAKFNLTYSIDQLVFAQSDAGGLLVGDEWFAYANNPTFTLRITAVEAVPAPGVFSLLGLGLLGLFGTRRRPGRRA